MRRNVVIKLRGFVEEKEEEVGEEGQEEEPQGNAGGGSRRGRDKGGGRKRKRKRSSRQEVEGSGQRSSCRAWPRGCGSPEALWEVTAPSCTAPPGVQVLFEPVTLWCVQVQRRTI